jgi:ribosomal protein S18 acetylase RimI-like enzyme
VDVVLDQAEPSLLKVVQSGQLSEMWFKAYTSASEYSQESLPIRQGILSRIGPQANFVLLEADGEVAATGLGVVERGWMGVFCVVTFSEFRRQGLALQVMHILAEWGKTAGAEQVYLQVMENNPPALGLYDKLGFEKFYEYWYSTKAG